MPGPAYSKPPIVEAVFEIRFAESLSPRELERLRDRFSSNFPKIELQQKIDIEVTNAGANAKATPVGFKMTSSNALDIVLMQVNQFGSSRMAPYEGWEKFIRIAKANYDDFTKIVGRKTITRIACRFINRLDIPVAEMEGVDILEFVRFGVAMPEELSKTIGPFSVAANFTVDNVKILAQCVISPPALLTTFLLRWTLIRSSTATSSPIRMLSGRLQVLCAQPKIEYSKQASPTDCGPTSNE
jgi:uncharacterized protein (TIGR04255 family)